MTTAPGIWTIDDEQREVFARLSGDKNPIHTDPVLARRELVGDVVIHGAHLVLAALDREIAVGRLRRIPSSVGVSFLRGVRPSTPMESEWSGDSSHLTVRIAETTSPAARIDLGFDAPVDRSAPALTGPPPDDPIGSSDMVDMAGTCGSFDVVWDDDLANELFPNVQALLGEQRTAEFASLSRVVGMRAPGRRSMSSRYHVDFHGGAPAVPLGYEVTRVDDRIAKVDLDVAGSTLSAHITAFRTPDPVDQHDLIGSDVSIGPTEFAGERVLIAGGSRGLGAAFALLAGRGGADVTVTYRVGADEASDVAATCGGRASHFDACGRRSVGDAVEPGWSPTVLIWCATPHLGNLDLAGDRELAEDIQIAALERSVVDLAELHTIIWPSATAEGTAATALRELKRHGEMRIIGVAERRPGLRLLTPRLPVLLTDQTMTLFPTDCADTTTELLAVLRDGLDGPTYTSRVQTDPLIDVFADGLGLGTDTLSDDTSPDNTPEWDSLAAMTLVSLVEDRFQVHLSTRDIMKMQTIGLARSVLRGKGVDGI